MKLPERVRVGYADYDVLAKDADWSSSSQRAGEHRALDHKMMVATNYNDVEMANTLIHEVLHALWHKMNLGESVNEEDCVTTLANGLTQVWRDNPDLIRSLDSALRRK